MVKWDILIATSLTQQFWLCLFVAYSMVKEAISEQFHVDQQFLGILEAISFFTRLIGAVLILLFHTKEEKLLWTVSGLLQIVFFLILSASHLFPTFAKVILIIGAAGFGLCRSTIMIPYILVSHQLDPERDKQHLNGWFAINDMGAIIGTLMAGLFLYTFNLHWTIIILVLCFLFGITLLLNHAIVPQTSSDSAEQIAAEVSVQQVKEIALEYLSKPSQFLLWLELTVGNGIYMNFVLWVPYYLMNIGVGSTTTFVVSLQTVAYILGNFFFEFINSLCEHKFAKLTTSILIAMCMAHIYLLFVPEGQESQLSYFILFPLLMFLLVYPLVLAHGQMMAPVKDDMVKKYVVMNLLPMPRELFSIVEFYLIGYFATKDLKNFLYINAIMTITWFLIHFIRRILQWKNRQKYPEETELMPESLQI